LREASVGTSFAVFTEDSAKEDVMATIDAQQDLMTLVNVFTVTPDKQQKLVDLLVRATQDTMRRVPGFVSASIHKGADGTKVINYAQWRSRAAFEALKEHPEARLHMRAAAALASFEPIVCEVVDSIS
jgi:heme-degrading monooxygenase HmoA